MLYHRHINSIGSIMTNSIHLTKKLVTRMKRYTRHGFIKIVLSTIFIIGSFYAFGFWTRYKGNGITKPIFCLTDRDYDATSDDLQVVGYNGTSGNCNLRPCDLNMGREPPIIRKVKHNDFYSVEKLVTLIVKTANRLDSVERLLDSLWKYYPNMNAIIIDDFNPNLEQDPQTMAILRSKKVTYLQTLPNSGISYGRNIALKLCNTKYFMQLDDDIVFHSESSIEKLIAPLDESDLTVAAFHVDGARSIEGVFRIYEDPKGLRHIIQYPGVAYQAVPCHPHCYMVDSTLNYFVGKTAEVREAGGWENGLPVMEHLDFFMNLRLHKLKVAVCMDSLVEHRPAKDDPVRKHRFQVKPMYVEKCLRKWGLQSRVECPADQYESIQICDEPKLFGELPSY
ncbi:unnamed protein product [Owenia fusiformis]|uniref:Uncharacterized protein n=1 Tax=Owenia fusiformis TaxID=6347 RepID=A0A8J1XGG4_OWEFU|nr:unnamed protein product [Owenia fusiformis]